MVPKNFGFLEWSSSLVVSAGKSFRDGASASKTWLSCHCLVHGQPRHIIELPMLNILLIFLLDINQAVSFLSVLRLVRAPHVQ